ncbi:MAG: Carboxypeptidase precursor, partial [Frankiales bacterium]|nr:Carboxypeptidase precursor [Frankiales bacterium]
VFYQDGCHHAREWPAAAEAALEPLKLARVWAGRKLLPGFDETHVVYADGSVQYLLWPGDLAKLDALGHRYEIEVEDLVARDAAAAAAAPAADAALAEQPGQSPTGDYRQYEDFKRDMDALAAKYPGFARVFELPYKTLQGRTVYGMEIATEVDRKDGRPVFYQDGCHHAREWPAAEVPLMWAYDLLENYTKDPAIRNIVDNVRNIIVPVVNADGFAYTRSFPPVETGEVGGVTNPLPPEAILLGGQARYTRKNRRPLLGKDVGDGQFFATQDPTYGSTTLGGIDPNRNYSYFWGDDEAGSSSDMFDQTYRGSDPLSEQESRNVAHVLKSHQVLAMNTNHTSGDLLLWAWGDTRDNAPDNDLLEGLGRAMATYNGYTPQKSIELYVTTGTCSDYAYGVLGSIGYTFEHAGSSFHPPYPTTVPAMYAKNRQAFILLATYVCMTPEQREGIDLGLSAAAQKELDKQGLTQDRLAHGVIKGRAVQSQGVGSGTGLGVPGALLTLTKVTETPLWTKGAGNPLGQKALPEVLTSTMEADENGDFVWHVNPSTRPALAFKGEKEYWTLTVTGPDGEGVSRRLHVERGDVIDLGNVVVG